MDLGNLLTLRYDPTEKSSGTLRRWVLEDFKLRSDAGPTSDEVETTIRAVIRKYVISSKATKISLALSTGVDSNVILSLIRNEFPDLEITCVSVSFDEYSEAGLAKKIAEDKSAYFENIIVDNPLRDLPHLISIVKEPRWNIYQYYFIEKSSQISKLLFTGDGGDELFGGYTFRYKKFLNLYNESLSWDRKALLYLDCHDRDWVPDQAEMFGNGLNFNWTKIISLFKNYFNNDLDPLDQVFMADYHGKLMYDFVPTNAKFFKYFNVLGIAPLLDASVVDISIKMPPTSKYDRARNIGKIPLRKIIGKYSGKMPSENKIGFGMDLPSLWNRIGREIVVSTLDNGRIFEDNLIQRDFYHRSLKRISDTHDIRYISKMLQLLSLELWYKMFVTFEISSKTLL
jgi:asparagine synthase (glutamine-hydrolysing)